MFNKKFLSIIIFLLIVLSIWFICDINSEIDLLLHKQKYSFKSNFVKNTISGDFYVAKISKETSLYTRSIYQDIKDIEQKYQGKEDLDSIKLKKYINRMLDAYYDIMLGKNTIYPLIILTNEDIKYINSKDETILYNILSLNSISISNLEDYKSLRKELKIRKEAIKEIKKDLKYKEIKARVTLDDIKFVDLNPEYLLINNIAPRYVYDFNQILKEQTKKQDKIIQEKIKDIDKNKDLALRYKAKEKLYSETFSNILTIIDDSWKHKYIVIVNEKTKLGNKKYYYEMSRYKDGNRYYWNIQQYPSDSEYIKAYLKLLELLTNL